MFKSVRLQNFFSFKDCTVELNAGLNVLLGINGSGKTNLLRAFQLLSEGLHGNGLRKLFYHEWTNFDQVFYAGRGPEEPWFVLEFVLDGQVLQRFGWKNPERDLHYLIRLGVGTVGKNYYFIPEEKLYYLDDEGKPVYLLNIDFHVGGQELQLRETAIPEAKMVKQALAEMAIYLYFDTNERGKLRGFVKQNYEYKLSEDGDSLTFILQQIKNENIDDYEKIREYLQQINPHFEDVDFYLRGDSLLLMLREKMLKHSIEGRYISEGTLRFLCNLAITCNSKRGHFVIVDEPDLALHHRMLSALAVAYRTSSMQTQYILTTHSHLFLNFFDIDEVHLTTKAQHSNETLIRKVNKDMLPDLADEDVWVGDLWLQGVLGNN